MIDYEVVWNTGNKTSLILWPEPNRLIKSFLLFDGMPHDQRALAALITPTKRMKKTSAPAQQADTRAVRHLAIMAFAGFMYIDPRDNIVRLTDLGRCVFSFLGELGHSKFANENNLPLVGGLMIRALSLIVEVRAIWGLMRLTGNRLNYEELNRAMDIIRKLSDVEAAAERVNSARSSRDPKLIGDRYIENDLFGTQQESEQRTTMYPQFMLAGAGGLVISTEERGAEFRTLADWACPIIDMRLRDDAILGHATREPSFVIRMSDYAGPPVDISKGGP